VKSSHCAHSPALRHDIRLATRRLVIVERVPIDEA
jgi:hypothetical protein